MGVDDGSKTGDIRITAFLKDVPKKTYPKMGAQVCSHAR